MKRLNLTEAADKLVVGEEVRGAQSGATATIYASRASQLAVRDSVDGTFQPGEEIRGSESRATSNLTAKNPVTNSRDHTISYQKLSRVWDADSSIDVEDLGDFTGQG